MLETPFKLIFYGINRHSIRKRITINFKKVIKSLVRVRIWTKEKLIGYKYPKKYKSLRDFIDTIKIQCKMNLPRQKFHGIEP